MRGPLIAGILIATCLVGVPALWAAKSDQPLVPQRADITVEAKEAPVTTNTPAEILPIIEESNILRVQIPSVMIDVGVSGPTGVRKSVNCHGAEECIDPPVIDQAAWFDKYSRPAVPSTNSVLLFGHSSGSSPLIFNNLPAVVAKDAIILTTETGVFTYEATVTTLVQYDQIHLSELVYGGAPNKLVLVTCNDKENAATVVVAHLDHAVAVSK